MTDVVVAGAGVIGLAVAWRAAQAGLTVVVVDDAPGAGASRAAAGMLAPVTEASYGEEALTALALISVARYPAFVAELQEASGREVPLRTAGTLLVGFDEDDARVLADLSAFHVELGLATERLTPREARRREPSLSPRVRGAVHAEGDLSVEPRALHAALLVACERAGVVAGARALHVAARRGRVRPGGRDGGWRRAGRAGGARPRRLERPAARRAVAARAPGQGAGAAAARRGAARRDRPGAGARPAGLPRAARRRRPRGGRLGRGARLRRAGHGGRGPRPAARRRRGRAGRHRAGAGRDVRVLASRHAGQRARCSARPRCPDWCSRPATTATACCSPR